MCPQGSWGGTWWISARTRASTSAKVSRGGGSQGSRQVTRLSPAPSWLGGELGATSAGGRALCGYRAVSSPLLLCSLSPSRLEARPLRVGLFAGTSDTADPASSKATLAVQLSAAVLQAAEGVEEATLFPGRQLSVLESSRHLLLPAAQPRSPGTLPPLLRPSTCWWHARTSSRTP